MVGRPATRAPLFVQERAILMAPPGGGFPEEEVNAALDRMASGRGTSVEDATTLLCCGYSHGLRRVKGDDSEPSQILRWVMKDKQGRFWDVFKVIEPDVEEKFYSRILPVSEAPKDLMKDWEEAFKSCA